jgi:hypothetical protein
LVLAQYGTWSGISFTTVMPPLPGILTWSTSTSGSRLSETEKCRTSYAAAALSSLGTFANLAHVHLWYERAFSHCVAPLGSLEEGIATWAEYATCIGLSLTADDELTVIAPHWLGDLFEMRVRHKPRARKSRDLREPAFIEALARPMAAASHRRLISLDRPERFVGLRRMLDDDGIARMHTAGLEHHAHDTGLSDDLAGMCSIEHGRQ